MGGDQGTHLHAGEPNAHLSAVVLPQRPAGTEDLDEDALADLVTPESLVGAALVPSPGAGPSPQAGSSLQPAPSSQPAGQ